MALGSEPFLGYPHQNAADVRRFLLAQAVSGIDTRSTARFRAAKQSASSAVPTVFAIMSIACGIGIAPRYGRAAVMASKMSAVVLMRVSMRMASPDSPRG